MWVSGRMYASQINTTFMLDLESLIHCDLASVVSRGKATPLDNPIVW